MKKKLLAAIFASFLFSVHVAEQNKTKENGATTGGETAM